MKTLQAFSLKENKAVICWTVIQQTALQLYAKGPPMISPIPCKESWQWSRVGLKVETTDKLNWYLVWRNSNKKDISHLRFLPSLRTQFIFSTCTSQRDPSHWRTPTRDSSISIVLTVSESFNIVSVDEILLESTPHIWSMRSWVWDLRRKNAAQSRNFRLDTRAPR